MKNVRLNTQFLVNKFRVFWGPPLSLGMVLEMRSSWIEWALNPVSVQCPLGGTEKEMTFCHVTKKAEIGVLRL